MSRILVLLIPLFATLCPAQCLLPKPAADSLAQLPMQQTGFARYRTEAVTYLEFRCYEEARAAIDRGGCRDETFPQIQWCKGMTAFISARVAWNQGRLADAKKTLSELNDEAQVQDVNVRAAFALAELLSQYPDPASWERLRPTLEFLGAERDMWRARHYLYTYGLDQSNAPARVRDLTKLVNSGLPIRQHLENLFILGDVLRRAGRSTEALLLVTSTEDDMGKYVVDVELRGAYVRLCAALWDARARQGDPEAVRLAGIYAAALKEIYDPR